MKVTAKTSTERGALLRSRRAAVGRFEVRGIFASLEDHAAIKAHARKLAAKRAKIALLRECAADDDYTRPDGTAGTTVRAAAMRDAADEIEQGVKDAPTV